MKACWLLYGATGHQCHVVCITYLLVEVKCEGE